MALNIKRPNGTEDVIPKNINKWHTVENIAKDVASMVRLQGNPYSDL